VERQSLRSALVYLPMAMRHRDRSEQVGARTGDERHVDLRSTSWYLGTHAAPQPGGPHGPAHPDLIGRAGQAGGRDRYGGQALAATVDLASIEAGHNGRAKDSGLTWATIAVIGLSIIADASWTRGLWFPFVAVTTALQHVKCLSSSHYSAELPNNESS
jgi:hypothetical protein